MTSKHRVFSHSNDINFNDYIKNKKGVEMIKNKKSKIGPTIIKYFYSYDDFINLTKVYYKYLTKGHIGIQVPTNILNTNSSFLIYDKINAHVNSCKYCYNLEPKCHELLNCDELLGILYPYGKYISNNINKNMYFPGRIDLSNWCCNTDVICEANNDINNDSDDSSNSNIFHDSDDSINSNIFHDSDINNNNKNNHCDCSLTNKRSLFI
jgi:hypothetical protein